MEDFHSYKIQQPLQYNSTNGSWEFNLPKAYKDIHSQGGIQIIIDPGYPTGGKGKLYKKDEDCGLKNPSITFKGYDNISGWISYAKFDLTDLLETLIKLVPKKSVDLKTYILALNDLKLKEKEKIK